MKPKKKKKNLVWMFRYAHYHSPIPNVFILLQVENVCDALSTGKTMNIVWRLHHSK